MLGFIVSFLVGILCIVIGISNRRGNISSLHEYHRNRVREEERIPFGRKVGLGMIIVGCAIILFSLLGAVALYTEKEVYTVAGTGAMLCGMTVGLTISLRAIKKYNKGIF